MKKRIHNSTLPIVTVALTAAILLPTASVYGGPKDRNAGRAAHTNSRDAIQTQIMRASSHFGRDIIGSDGRKVGDIVDFVFDLQGPPRLAYVLSMTGGFLDLGGDVRAIPASAIQMNDGAVRIDLDKSRYDTLAVLPDNRRQYLENNAHRSEIDRIFGRDNASRNDRRPAQLRFYSNINGREVYSQEGQRIGVVRDAWVSLDAERAPYVEVDPQQTDQAFSATDTGRHYVLPLAKLDPNLTERSNAVTFALTEQEIESADSVTEQEGVRRVETDTVGDLVLRVTLPATASRDNRSARNNAGDNGRAAIGAAAVQVQIPQKVALAPDDVSNATLRHHAGQTIRTDQGQQLGTVEDFAIEAGSGEIAGVIVSTGGFMGLGERQHLIPVKSLRQDAARSGYTLEIDEAQFRSLPVLADASGNEDRIELTDQDRQSINGVFGSEALQKAKDGNDRYVRLSSLRGRTVRNHGGEIGEVEAIVVDTRDGRAAALLDPDANIANDDQKFLVPLAQLELGVRDDQALTTEVSLDEFRRVSNEQDRTASRRQT